MIVSDPRNPRAQRLDAALRERLGDVDPALTVVLGGDGFLLETVHRYGFERCYLGLNAGTLGFLLNDASAGLDAIVQALVEQRWREHRFPLLEARVRQTDGHVHVDHAMNDVYLERATGQTARIDVRIGGHGLERLHADGLILATALGSTAYNFSAGGVPCTPELPVMCVTPIAPHRPRLSPFIVPYGTIASIDVYAPERRPVRVVVDGRDIDRVAHVEVGPAGQSVCIAYLDGHEFTTQMIDKLLT